MKPITERVEIPRRGSTTTLDVLPPRPCALGDCVAELWVQIGYGGPTRVHLDEEQRRALIGALGGIVPEEMPRIVRGADMVNPGPCPGDWSCRPEEPCAARTHWWESAPQLRTDG